MNGGGGRASDGAGVAAQQCHVDIGLGLELDDTFWGLMYRLGNFLISLCWLFDGLYNLIYFCDPHNSKLNSGFCLCINFSFDAELV